MKQPLPSTNEQDFSAGILYERGKENTLFVIAFTGGDAGLMMQPYEFMSVTQLKRYSRVYLRDSRRLWYLAGIGGEINSFQRLCSDLERKFRESGAKKLLIVGTSSGGFAALLAGHRLRANYVHAFAPLTNIGPSSLINRSELRLSIFRLRKMTSLYARQWRNHKMFDLRKAMQTDNGRTRYYVHYCAKHDNDQTRVDRISERPGVEIFGYPCSTHGVMPTMLRDNYLEKLFMSENLDDVRSLFNRHYVAGTETLQPEPATENSSDWIVKILQETAVCRPSEKQVRSSGDLIKELALDSMTCLQIIVKLENSFRVALDTDVVSFNDLRTVETIRNLVHNAPSLGTP